MKILVLAAHPDDEVLGCGGTLYKLSKDKKNQIFIGFAANGVGGRSGGEDSEKILKRRKESNKVARLLKAKIINPDEKGDYQFEDQRLDRADFNQIVGWIKQLIKFAHPEIIYTHHLGDLNRDHRILAEAVLVAVRPSKFDFVKKVYFFEVNMADARLFEPNVFERLNLIDVKIKQKLFSLYQSEHPYWSTWKEDIETIAKYRGMNSGFDYAEALELFRERRD